MDVNTQINSIFSTNQLHDLVVYYPTKFTSVLLSYWPIIIGVAVLFSVLFFLLRFSSSILWYWDTAGLRFEMWKSGNYKYNWRDKSYRIREDVLREAEIKRSWKGH